MRISLPSIHLLISESLINLLILLSLMQTMIMMTQNFIFLKIRSFNLFMSFSLVLTWGIIGWKMNYVHPRKFSIKNFHSTFPLQLNLLLTVRKRASCPAISFLLYQTFCFLMKNCFSLYKYDLFFVLRQ